MSGGARNVLSLLTQNFLWMRNFTTTVEEETKCRCLERMGKVAEKMRRLDVGSGSTSETRGVDIMLPEYEQGEPRRGAGGILTRGGGNSRAASNPRSTGGAGGAVSASMAGSGGGVKGDGKTVADKEDGGELGKVCQEVVDIATEKLIGSIVQVSKKELFSS
jgi:hypothetical protein